MGSPQESEDINTTQAQRLVLEDYRSLNARYRKYGMCTICFSAEPKTIKTYVHFFTRLAILQHEHRRPKGLV